MDSSCSTAVNNKVAFNDNCSLRNTVPIGFHSLIRNHALLSIAKLSDARMGNRSNCTDHRNAHEESDGCADALALEFTLISLALPSEFSVLISEVCSPHFTDSEKASFSWQ